MLKIIVIMLAGALLGASLRKVRAVGYVTRSISWTIYLMLFLLGMSVGSNPEIIGNLSSLGLQAFLLAFAGTSGSLLAGWGADRCFRPGPDSTGTTGKDGSNPDKTGQEGSFIKRISGSLVTVGLFLLGTIAGVKGLAQEMMQGENAVLYVLYFLMFQVGISLGHDTTVSKAIKGMNMKVLLLPLATITGTLSFSAIAGLALSKWSVANCLAVGSGFAYYSLSSVLIAECTSASLGAQLAAELGTVALLTNIFREISCLLLTPLYVKCFGKIAPICAAGATSIDVTLPVLIKNCGKEYLPYAIIQGVVTDFSVPFFVTFFCSL